MNTHSCPASLNLNTVILKRYSIDKSGFKVLPEIRQNINTEREHLIVCRICGNVITSPDKKIDVNGLPGFTFTNPAGIKFNVICFSAAKGCISFGDPTSENTWFPDYLWSYAMCAECVNHLGWFYRSSQQSFYGLIPEKLFLNS